MTDYVDTLKYNAKNLQKNMKKVTITNPAINILHFKALLLMTIPSTIINGDYF